MSNDEERVNVAYISNELTKAFVTALTSNDAQTAKRAEIRASKWREVLDGILSGALKVGSRTPTEYPAWVTLEVLRGGFATGKAVAEGDSSPSELSTFDTADTRRENLFSLALTEVGQSKLGALVDDKRYRVNIPEEAALLAVCWLARNGDLSGAADVVSKIAPFAGRMKFLPEIAEQSLPDDQIAWRMNAGEARYLMAHKRDNKRVAAMNETLSVWTPLKLEFLTLWDSVRRSDTVVTDFDATWHNKAHALLLKYARASAQHEQAKKHTNPKENLYALRSATHKVCTGESLSNRELGRVVHAVRAARQKQARGGYNEVARATHASIAKDLAPYFDNLDPELGITDPLNSMSSSASSEHHQLPPSVTRILRRTTAAPIEELVELGLVPSGEVLAELSPHLSAATVASAYEDPALGSLAGATYKAFRSRRSLLLLDLQHQVRFNELPWISALDPHRRVTPGNDSAAAARTLARLALANFPGTITPNPLTRELDALMRLNRTPVPLVEELAADIFMGRFSMKFVAASKRAGSLLHDSIYARYYGVDYTTIAEIETVSESRHTTEFDELCITRAGLPVRSKSWRTPAENGRIIEQAQILTTHNLAVIWNDIGVSQDLAGNTSALAQSCLDIACLNVKRSHNTRRALRFAKDAAYAWRQMMFFLSQLSVDQQRAFLSAMPNTTARHAAFVADALQPAVCGLEAVMQGARFGSDGTVDRNGRLLLGWSTGEHWLVKLTNPAR